MTFSLKPVLIFITGISFSLQLEAQSPFKSFSQADVIILEAGVLLEGFYRIVKPKELGEFDKDLNKIPSFERHVIHNNSLQAHHMSNIVLVSTGAIALGNQFVYDDLSKTGYIAMETFLVSDVLNLLSKTFFSRTRPFVYNENMDVDKEGCETYDMGKADIRTSFYSGHASAAAAYTFLSASMFSHYYPNSGLRAPVWITAGAVSAYMGYLRVRSGKHFPTDVITGFVIGGATGFFIPRWHRADNFDEDDGTYWRDFGLGIGGGIVAGVLFSVLDKDPAPRQCERGLASKLNLNAGPTGFSLVYNF